MPDQNGEVHKLSDYAGKKVILYFYPKDKYTRMYEAGIKRILKMYRKVSDTTGQIYYDCIL